MGAFLNALAPHLLELIAAILTIIIGWLAADARARWSIEIEARHREALHSALLTGVKHVHALRTLKPGPQQLVEMAEAKLEGLARP